MFCGNCGCEFQDGAAFCPNCGWSAASQSDTYPPNVYQQDMYQTDMNGQYVNQSVYMQSAEAAYVKPRQKMTKGKKTKIIIIGVLSLVLALCIACGVMFLACGPYKAMKNIKDGKYTAAVKIYDSDISDNFLFDLMLSLSLKGYDDKIVEEFKNGSMSYDNAVGALNAIQEIGVGDETDNLAAVNKLNDSNIGIENGDKYYSEGNYEKAITEYNKVSQDDERYSEIQTKLQDAVSKYKSDKLAAANTYIDGGNYEEALSLLGTAKSVVGDDGEIIALYNQAVSTYETVTVQQAKQAVAEERYDDAEDILEKALKVLPDSASLSQELSDIQATRPVSLVNTSILYSGEYYEIYTRSDGNSFSVGADTFYEGVVIRSYGNALFDLKGEYSKMVFNVGRISDADITDVDIKIYLDDEFVEEHHISADTTKQTITVDLKYADHMKIELVEGAGWSTSYGFTNILLYK